MRNYRISLPDLPPEGRHMALNDQEIWIQSITEFGMDCRITEALHADLTIVPAGEGVLIRGQLTGGIVLPCDRCTEDALVHLNHGFEFFESLSEQPLTDSDDDSFSDASGLIVWEQGTPLLDMAALCWEEFVLALPVKPLCREDCKGLCSSCGTNLNRAPCTCSPDEGDPRLAALRSLRINTPAPRTPGQGEHHGCPAE